MKTVAPADPQAYQALGIFYSSTGQKEKAAAEFQALLKAHPKDTSTKAYLVETLLDLNRTGDAEPLIQEILSSNPGDPRGLQSKGRILLAQGQYDSAMDTLQKAVKAAPDSAPPLFSGRCAAVCRISRFGQSFLHARFGTAAANGFRGRALANLAVRKGNNAEGLRLAESARKTDPNLPSANLAAAQALIAKGDHRQAETSSRVRCSEIPLLSPLATLLNLIPGRDVQRKQFGGWPGRSSNILKRPAFTSCWGWLTFRLKIWLRSETSVRQALKLDPQIPDAYTLLANIALARGSAEEAKSLLRTAIAIFPRKLLNYMALVTQYEKEGNWEEAKRLCEKAHEIDTTSPLVAAELAFLYLEHGGDVNTAVSLAQIAKQKLPDSPITADALGWAYYKLGSLGSAVVQLKESSEKVPNNPIYHYHLGMAYIASRRFDLASQSLRAALRTDPSFPYAANARSALEQIPKGVH